jgi:uncharacterized RDD family membrane protein YckC
MMRTMTGQSNPDPTEAESTYEPAVPLVTDSAGDTRAVGRRCFQYMLDVFLAIIVALVVSAAVTLGLGELLGRRHLGVLLIAFPFEWISLSFLLIVLLYVWWPFRHGGRTPAMRWLGLRVVTMDGGQPQLSAFVLRWLLMVVDGFLFGIVGAVVMANSGRQQRVGDMVAGTLVVRERRRR